MPSACCACSAAHGVAEAGGTRTLIRLEQAPYLRSQQISANTPAGPMIGPGGGLCPSPFLSGAMDPVALFHPAVADWFDRSFAAPTAAQAQAWPAIQAGRHVLIAAPTGSGKTLAAFLAAIDALVRQGLARRARGRNPDRLCLAAQGAVERHPAQSGSAARRHPRGLAARRACPTSRSAPGCAPATRRRASATACAAARRTSS